MNREKLTKTFVMIYSCFTLERDMAQWLERGALAMSLPVVRFRIPFGAEFSPLNRGTLLRCCVLGQGTSSRMLRLIQVKMST